MKRKLLLGSVFSGLLLYLALRGIEWQTLWQTLGHTRYLYLIPSIAFSLLNLYVRAYRWKFILQPVKRISTNSLFTATTIGYMANNLLPARLGEVVRAYVIGRREDISKSASFATIVYERIVDVFSLLAFLWICFFDIEGPEWLRRGAFALLAANGIAFAALVLMERNRAGTARWVLNVTRPLPPAVRDSILHVTDAFLSGLAAVRDARMLIPIGVTTVLTWIFAALGVYYCFFAVDIELSVMASLTVIVLISLSSMIPSAPAYVGPVQVACIVALAFYGIGKSQALAYSIVYHASVFFPVTVLGLILLWRDELGWRDIARRERPYSSS